MIVTSLVSTDYFSAVSITDIIGYIASICMVFGYMPQAIYTIRTRKTDDIAMSTFLLMAIGGFFFAVQGYMLGNMPLLLTNIITTSSSAIVFGIKLYNDHFKIKDKDIDCVRRDEKEDEK